ncbi:dihydrolipoamide acetyltransferase [Pirellulaceae bacterium SH449]
MAGKKEKAETAKDVKAAAHGATDGAEPKKGGGLAGKLLVAAFVSGVIITETFVFFFLVPSGEQIAALAEQRLIAQAQEIDSKDKVHKHVEEEIVEFHLPVIAVHFRPVGTDSYYRVEFVLYAEVLAKNLDHLIELFASMEGRVKNRLMLEIRQTSLQELEENQLGLLQRRLLATVTQMLGKDDLLLNVGFAEYQVLED